MTTGAHAMESTNTQKIEKIGAPGILALFKACESLQGYFPAVGARPVTGDSWESSGYQLIFHRKIPTFADSKRGAKRERLADIYEWSTVTVGNLSEAPDLYLQTDPQNGIAKLIGAYLRECAKGNQYMSGLRPRRAFWGSDGDKPTREARFTIDADETTRSLSGPIVTLGLGDSYSYHAGFAFSDAREFSRIGKWSRRHDRDNLDPYRRCYYFEYESDK